MAAPSTPRRSPVAVAVVVFLLISFLVAVACRFPGPTSPAPAGSASTEASSTPPALSRLRALVSVARPLLSIAGLACLALPEPSDRSTCQATVAALRAALGLAQGALATADTCEEADRACLEAVEAEAARQIPELERLAYQVEELSRGEPVSEDPYAVRDILRQMRAAAGGQAGASPFSPPIVAGAGGR